VTATATVWRTCPSCGRSFEQPDDPGRKRVYCSRACQQAAYRARQRQRADGHQQRTGRQEQRHGRQGWRSDQRQQRASSGGDGAGQRQRGGRQRQQWRQPPPTGANGQRPGATSGGVRPKVNCYLCHGLRARGHTFHHDQAAHERARRRYQALLRKAAGTPFEHEAAACRAKAEELYAKYGL
jgi:hypothetical protein